MNTSIQGVLAGAAARLDREASVPYQVFMLGLCLYAIGTLAVDTLLQVSPEVGVVLDYADTGVCVVFFLDFLLCLYRAKGRRWSYFFSWGWLDLLSSIPMLDVARWGRLARVFRISRVLRGLRMTQITAALLSKHRAESTILASSLAALILVVTCSVAILRFEDAPDSNIRDGGDAIWWAFATITTVGYGDRFPVTAEGRVVAAILMTAGVGFGSTIAAFLAAWFLQPKRRQVDSEESATARELRSLREAIDRLGRDSKPN